MNKSEETKIKVTKKKKKLFGFLKKPNFFIYFLLGFLMLFNLSIITLGILGFRNIKKTINVYMINEKQRWFDEHYYLKTEIKEISNKEERKRVFQLKAVGFMKENKTNLDEEELTKYTNLVFDECENIGLDPYIALATAFIESKFDKKSVDKYDRRGLYKILPGTAMDVGEKIGIEYYNGLEFNVEDNTKIWIGRIKTLLKRFNNNEKYALLAYDKGEKAVIEFSGMKVNRELGTLNIESGSLYNIKKELYDNLKTYDEKIFEKAKEIKNKGKKD
jgi:hypothetical protein